MLHAFVGLSLSALLSPQESYKLPPAEVVALVEASIAPTPRLSPDANWILFVERPPLPSIVDVARPWVGLAGMRIDPARNAPQQVNFDRGLVLRELVGGTERRVALPHDARIGSVDWAHDSARFAFTLVEDDDVELWVADVASGKAERVAERLNPLFDAFTWMPDARRVIVKLKPTGHGAVPAAPRAPTGPAAMESSGKKSPVRTFQDVLKDEYDALSFEHFTLAQLAVIDTADRSVRKLGAPGMISRFSPSPDGAHVLVTTMSRPFSYVLTAERFPARTEVWNAEGGVEFVVAEQPLLEQIPIEGVPTGRRSIQWRAGLPATLVWLEALDGGDPKVEVPQRDRWLALHAPFKDPPKEFLRTEHRARGLSWFDDPELVLAGEYDRDRRWTRTTLHDLSGKRAALVLEDRNVNDRYGNPGSVALDVRLDGTRVVRRAGDWIYRLGDGNTPEGARPFLDRQNIATRASERLWLCDPGVYESVAGIARLDNEGRATIVTRRESKVEPPNLHLRDLAAKTDVVLTNVGDPQPAIRGIQRELVTYQRADGVPLSATLYLPADYEPGTRLPLVVWAYPLEFTDPATAGQVSGSQHRFTTIRGASHLFFLTQGYAVMDDATMPIVGDPETMNDTFLEQIAASAQAAIDYAAQRGVADPTRVGVGGHSYGAFMTANLLAHTDLFRAGCARSGAYNRTLTPFGFQSERRTLWEAPRIYEQLSPFYHAHKINEPLLLIHGEKDSNSGTFPIQSERLYQAIAGNGGTVRWVVLPEESHGYAARESVLHTLAEMIEWFDRHVKGPASVEAASPVRTTR